MKIKSDFSFWPRGSDKLDLLFHPNQQPTKNQNKTKTIHEVCLEKVQPLLV